jgi:hypothetical protein
MSLCRALTIAVYLSPLAAGAAAAQTAWPAPAPQQQAAPASAWPAPAAQQQAPAAQQESAQQQPAAAWPAPSQPAQSGAWPAPNASAPAPQQGFIPPPTGFGPSLAAPQQPQEPPCYKDFMALRQEADKKGRLIQEASKKKVPPTVACKLFNDYSASEAKLVKYASTNATKCEIPKEIVDNLTKSHSKTNEIRTRVCEVAASGPPKPRGPSLSDALSAPVPDSGNIKTGRGGTFDTLSGGALGK